MAAAALLVAAWSCGPKSVHSPDWVRSEPARYPASQYLIGVGSAPTSGGLSEALRAASAEARTEVAKTIEVRVEHIQRLVEESTSSGARPGRAGRDGPGARLAAEAERSDLRTFTSTSTEQIVQGIALKEKFHDEERGILYVLAVLDKVDAGERLERRIRELDVEAGLLSQTAALRQQEGDWLAALRLRRQALSQALRAELLRDQLRVVDPYRTVQLDNAGAQLAVALSDLFTRYRLHVTVPGYPLLEDAVHEALVDAGFDAAARRGEGDAGLTLWGTANAKHATHPALGGAQGGPLQVCRLYLGIKIVDDRTGAIVGQINLLDNSNAETAQLAEERAALLLRRRILDELPAELVQALSIESD